jgi:2-oxoadipate dioxygenase/decarboxylase
VNQLSQFRTLAEVNQRLKDEGFRLNTSGGEVKGSPQDLLEQSSTMADRADVAFSDKTVSIPSCFYEFALRYPKPDGKLYSGFVAASADKIFESTDSKG